MNQNKPPVYRCPECCEQAGHLEGCKAGTLPDLVMAKDGRDEPIILNGLPVEEIHLDWVCSFLSEESIFNGSDLLQAYRKLVAFYVAHRSVPALASPASPASAPEASELDPIAQRTEDIRQRMANPTSIPRSALLHYTECLLGHIAILAAPLPPVVARKDGDT